MNTTINVEETIQTINKQNKRIEELCLEIEKLKEDIEAISASHFSVFKRYEDYKSRNKKAIEYIKEWQSFPHTNGSTHNELRNLLNILQGEDKE